MGAMANEAPNHVAATINVRNCGAINLEVFGQTVAIERVDGPKRAWLTPAEASTLARLLDEFAKIAAAGRPFP